MRCYTEKQIDVVLGAINFLKKAFEKPEFLHPAANYIPSLKESLSRAVDEIETTILEGEQLTIKLEKQ